MLHDLTVFLGWASLIHIGLLSFTALILLVAGPRVASLHAAMFGVEADELPLIYFRVLAHYKILILTFFVVPYLVLRLAM